MRVAVVQQLEAWGHVGSGSACKVQVSCCAMPQSAHGNVVLLHGNKVVVPRLTTTKHTANRDEQGLAVYCACEEKQKMKECKRETEPTVVQQSPVKRRPATRDQTQRRFGNGRTWVWLYR